jgi:hypothetical protein
MLKYRGYCIQVEAHTKGYQAVYHELPDTLLPGVEPKLHRTEFYSKITSARLKAKSDIVHLINKRKKYPVAPVKPKTENTIIQGSLF